MGLIGLAILISLIVWFVFGWDYMVSGWETVFEYFIRLMDALILKLEST